MGKTIMDYIQQVKSVEIDKDAFINYLELVHKIALVSSKAFLQLYELVTKSNDKKLKKQAQRLFGKTTIEIVATLHKIQELSKYFSKNTSSTYPFKKC